MDSVNRNLLYIENGCTFEKKSDTGSANENECAPQGGVGPKYSDAPSVVTKA